jgi:hypothetical protein
MISRSDAPLTSCDKTRPSRAQRVHAWLALLTCALLCVSGVWAVEDVPSKVAPDRPDVSNSTETVPLGALQIETGLEYARSSVADGPDERRLAAQATIRTGLTDRLEVRLEGEPLVRLRQEQDDTGIGDLDLGLKYRFFDPPEGQWWPSLGVQPFIKVPVAKTPIGSARTDFGLLALATQELPWQLSLDVNAGLVAVGQPHGYLLQALASASVSREFTERLSPFVEVFFASRDERDGRDTLGLDAGVIYFLTRRLALDAAMAAAFRGNGPDYAFRAGFSLRIGR